MSEWTLGKKIKSLRKEMNESQTDFGRHFNPPAQKGLVSRWESDKTVPSDERLQVIAKLAGTTVINLKSGSLEGAVDKAASLIRSAYEKHDWLEDIDEDNLPLRIADYIRLGNWHYRQGVSLDGLSYSELEEKEHEWFIRGLNHCSTRVTVLCKSLKVEPYQEELIMVYFEDVARRYSDQEERDNRGLLNTVNRGFKNIYNEIDELFYGYAETGEEVNLAPTINPKLYDSIEEILVDAQQKIKKVGQRFDKE